MSVTVTARRWEQGWELSIDGEPVTQTAVLDHAADQVREYLDTVAPETDHASWQITVMVEDDVDQSSQQR